MKFIMGGAVSAGMNFSSRVLFNLKFNYTVSIILAYGVGMIVAFCLFKIFVFEESKNSTKRSVMVFIMVNLFGLIQTVIISLLLNDYLLIIGVRQFRPEIAHLIGLGTTTITSFFGHKYFTFPKGK
ncbi:MAG: GtrA family protein [Candidatus Gracilibacteria bacterium]